MSAPPRVMTPQDRTAAELAAARAAEFTGAVFAAGIGLSGQRGRTGFGEAWRRCQELQDEAAQSYRRKLAQWEADEPMRRQAERAYERAQRARAAEAGAAAPVRVAACLDWMRPQPPAHLIGRI